MTGPSEPHVSPRPPRAATARCLLVADGSGPGPALLAALRRCRSEHADLSVHVVVPARPTLAAALAVGDPLAGWVVIDPRAAYEWELASRQEARRRLDELLWLLWEMELPATGEVVHVDLSAALAVDRPLLPAGRARPEGDRAPERRPLDGYDAILVVRPRAALARWRQGRWLQRARRSHPWLELVDEPRRRTRRR